MSKWILYIVIMAGLPAGLWAQPQPAATDTGKQQAEATHRLPFIIRDKDTLPVYVMQDATIISHVDAEMLQKQKEWNRMLYNLRKVWPYAQVCAIKMKEIDSSLSEKDRKREQKKYLKSEEDKLRDEFTDKLKDLTQSQGALLVKLVSRQTGQPAYELIKEYKNGMSAFFWNSFASVYGMSLKENYDPAKEPEIEAAIKELGYE